MFTNDSFITDVIIFSANIGIHITGPANVLTGIHIFGITNNTQITKLTNKIGLLIDGGYQLRIVNCEFDSDHLVIYSPIYDINIENSFFIGYSFCVFESYYFCFFKWYLLVNIWILLHF